MPQSAALAAPEPRGCDACVWHDAQAALAASLPLWGAWHDWQSRCAFDSARSILATGAWQVVHDSAARLSRCGVWQVAQRPWGWGGLCAPLLGATAAAANEVATASFTFFATALWHDVQSVARSRSLKRCGVWHEMQRR